MSYLLYCILPSQDTLDSPGLLGVGGEPVGLVSCNGLSAAVSRIGHYKVTPPISSLLAFKEVVEYFHRSPGVRGVIPMRYGCMVDDKAQIPRLLEKHRSHYTALLKEVEGCVEMGIRVIISDFRFSISDSKTSIPCPVKRLPSGTPTEASTERACFTGEQIANPWPRPAMPGSSDGRTDIEQQQKQENIQVTSRSPRRRLRAGGQGGRKSQIANPGRAYLAARKVHYTQEEKFNKQVEQVIERCRAAFGGLFVKCKTEVPSIANFQLSIRNPFPSIYFLIPRESIAAFRRAFRRLIKSSESASLLLSGPWPPYNFVQPEHTEGGI
jgi:hypothetical protein